ncbi:MAG: ABC transporter ATP-binding protein, partial [Actinomycetota bacterium]
TLQADLGVSYLFISHDLSVVRHMSDRIVVLYRGRIMEIGDATDIHDRPAHPYTQTLLAASPIPDPGEQRHQREFIELSMRPAMPGAPVTGCRFANRCPFTTAICVAEEPPLAPGPTGTIVACHHSDVAVQSFSAAGGSERTA